jgi:predicted RNase H-like HicB family nuclease
VTTEKRPRTQQGKEERKTIHDPGTVSFTAVFEHTEDGWWIGYVEEVPGANTQGETLEEARENLKEALRMVLEANRELAEADLEGRDDVIREQLAL